MRNIIPAPGLKNHTKRVLASLILLWLLLSACDLQPRYSSLAILSHGIPARTATERVFCNPSCNDESNLAGWLLSLESRRPAPRDSRWSKEQPCIDLPGYGSHSLYLWALDNDGKISRTAKANINYKPFDGDWTFMVWMDGDNDLEGNALRDMYELEAGFAAACLRDPLLEDKLAVIVQLDRINGYTSQRYASAADWTDSRRFRINNPSSDQPRVSQLSPGMEMNMGDPGNVRDFIRYCRSHFPADHYALIFWNHGGGMIDYIPSRTSARALCVDITNQSDFLYVAEITDYLGDSEDVDLIGFDACLMGTAEIAYQYRPGAGKFGANYFVASPGEIARDGWEYKKILTRLGSRGSDAEGDPCYDVSFLRGEQLAEIFIKEFADSQAGITEDKSLIALDLSQIGNVKKTLDKLAASLGESTNCQNICESIRGSGANTNCLEYFDQTSTAKNNPWLQFPHFDLYDFAHRLSQKAGIPVNTSNYALNLQQAVCDCILSSYGGPQLNNQVYHGQFMAGSHGLAFFFPDGNGKSPLDGEKYYHHQWAYTAADTNAWRRGCYYGKLDFCDSDLDNSIETWRELLEFWFDRDSTDKNLYTPGGW